MSHQDMLPSPETESEINLARLSFAYSRLDAVVWKLASALGELNVPSEVWREIRVAREFHHIASPEPVFVLRGRDVLAPKAVRRWAELAMLSGVPRDKIESALAVADSMEEWPIRRVPD